MAAIAALLVAAACTGPMPSPTSTFPRVGSPAAISGASPFHACSHQGQIALDSEVEPSLAVDPADPGRLLAAWQQDRNFRGGALGILTATSGDGGAGWEIATPAVTRCAGDRYDLASDPVVSIGPGRAYLAAIGIDVIGTGSATRLDDEVVVSTSGDGGRTWGPAGVVVTSPDPLVNFDKETLQADPRRPDVAYVLWVRYTSPDADRAAKTNETFFSRTDDGGATWSTPVRVYGADTETQFHQLVVLSDGSLLDAFIEAPSLSERPPVQARLAAVHSADGGVTWSAPVTVAEVEFTVVVDPTNKDQVRGTGQGVLAAAGPDGSAYVAWAEEHQDNGSFLAAVRSDDAGRTWSQPSRIVSASSGQPFIPQVAVASDGTVGVTWYQVGGEKGHELDTEVWLAWSRDQGGSWQSARIAGPFDLRTAPLSADGDFVGDYEGLVPTADGFAALYAMAKPPSRSGATDIFFSRVELGPFP